MIKNLTIDYKERRKLSSDFIVLKERQRYVRKANPSQPWSPPTESEAKLSSQPTETFDKGEVSITEAIVTVISVALVFSGAFIIYVDLINVKEWI